MVDTGNRVQRLPAVLQEPAGASGHQPDGIGEQVCLNAGVNFSIQ